jgi:hypothetical protein
LNSSEKFTSTYYPRRARWYGRIFYLGTIIRHRLAMDRIRMPDEITLVGIMGGFFIPGLAVYLRGPRLWGQAVLLACAFLFLCFIVWLGYPFGNYAFGLMLSIHTTGFVYYCGPCLLDKDFGFRILFTLAILLALGLALYMPLRGAIQNHWLMPLQMNGRSFVVQRFISAHTVKRGDLVAYKLTGYFFSNHNGQGSLNQTSLGLGAVLATAGDRVGFSTNNFTVNGVPQLLLPHMPESGALVIQKNHWLIWPSLAISGNWDVGEANISAAMLQMADVSENQFVGKPFKHWFWRTQILP